MTTHHEPLPVHPEMYTLLLFCWSERVAFRLMFFSSLPAQRSECIATCYLPLKAYSMKDMAASASFHKHIVLPVAGPFFLLEVVVRSWHELCCLSLLRINSAIQKPCFPLNHLPDPLSGNLSPTILCVLIFFPSKIHFQWSPFSTTRLFPMMNDYGHPCLLSRIGHKARACPKHSYLKAMARRRHELCCLLPWTIKCSRPTSLDF